MARNISVFDTPLSPGGLQVLWITEYDEIYSYPASILTFQRWVATGLEKIVQSRLHALGQNLQTSLAVQGGIFLTPLIMLGIWHLRGDLRIWLGLFAWFTTFIVMIPTVPLELLLEINYHSMIYLKNQVYH